MTTLVEQLINKMGLRDEDNVKAKTTELLRLLELRSTNVPLKINEYGRIVLCVDIAATLLCVAFDKEQALKIAGLRKSHYGNYKRMFEKLLDLNRILDVNDICKQLSITEVAQKADELLQLYKKVVGSENADIDVTHPQYAAMAVYQACKLLLKKCSKPKILPFSNLRPTQWHQLEQRWDKFLLKYYKNMKDSRLGKPAVADVTAAFGALDKGTDTTVATSHMTIIEDYKTWKKRILAKAEYQLQQHMEKENTLLGS